MNNQLREIDLAYAAGILDGEGCIVIHKNTTKLKSGKYKKPYYNLNIHILNVNKEVIDWFWVNFGGSIYIGNTTKGREYFDWRITCRKAAHFLETLLPYLKIKRLQAEIAITFQKRKYPIIGSKGKKTTEEWALDEADKVLISMHNQGKAAI